MPNYLMAGIIFNLLSDLIRVGTFDASASFTKEPGEKAAILEIAQKPFVQDGSRI